MRNIALLFFAVFSITACKKGDTPEFDRALMLENTAETQIIPSVANFKVSLDLLNTATNNFTSATSADNLIILKNRFTDTYFAFQEIKMFNFGPIEDAGIVASVNTYPTDISKIDANIESGTYNLAGLGNIDAIGLPALDYLLFSGESEITVLNRFASDASAENAKAYLNALVEKMVVDYSPVMPEWNTYKTSFTAADGNDVGSSISQLYNAMVVDLELVKNAKIGIPAGQFSGGETFPTFVEAYYAQLSQQLALANIAKLKAVFTGGEGQGYDDYMNFNDPEKEMPATADDVIVQFDVCYNSIAALNAPFSTDVTTNYGGFSDTFQQIKKLVAYAKTDIPASIGVMITFSDTDGD